MKSKAGQGREGAFERIEDDLEGGVDSTGAGLVVVAAGVFDHLHLQTCRCHYAYIYSYGIAAADDQSQ